MASTGGRDRAQENPLLPIAMSAKILIDAVAAAELAREEWNQNKALCAYCQVATLCSFASLALALPETVSAVQHLLDQNSTKPA